jgi:hypothetical protein
MALQIDQLQRVQDRIVESLRREIAQDEEERRRSVTGAPRRRQEAVTEESTEVPEEKMGALGGTFRTLRKPQQYLGVGPALALARGAKTPQEFAAIQAEAIDRDLSFRDVAREAGLKGRTAWVAGTLGDLILDPLNLLPFGIAGKGVRAAARGISASRAAKSPLAQAAGKAVAKLGRDVKETAPVQYLGRKLVTDFGKQQRYLDLRRQAQLREAKEVREAMDLGAKINTLPKAEQRLISEYMNVGNVADIPNPKNWGDMAPAARQKWARTNRKPKTQKFIETERLKIVQKAKPQHQETVRSLSETAVKRDVAQGADAVRYKLMKEETRQKRAGSHLRRFFSDLKKNPAIAPNINPNEVPFLQKSLEFLRNPRGRFTPEALSKMNLIEEAAYPVARGQAELGQAISRQQFLQRVSREIALSKKKTAIAGKLPATARREAFQGYKQLPKDEALGPLSQRWVPTNVHYELSRKGIKGSKNAWEKGVGIWKFKSVVLNPATHSKNIIGDFALADMAGLGPLQGAKAYAQAFRSLAKKDELYDLAKDYGTHLGKGTSMIGADVPLLMDTVATSKTSDFKMLQDATTSWANKAMSSVIGGAKKVGAKASDWYQGEEQWFKHAFFINHLQQSAKKIGRPWSKIAKGTKERLADEASQAAEEAIFDYSRVPEAIDQMRRSGLVPFVTFPYKAMAATGRALWKNPSSLTRQGNVVRMFEPPIEERQAERTGVPEWMERGTWARLPQSLLPGLYTEESLTPETQGYVPLDYILPSADPSEIIDAIRDRKIPGILGEGGRSLSYLSSPIWELASAVKTGRDEFTQKDIEDRPGGWQRYLWDFAAPPPLSYGGRRLLAAAKGEPTNPLTSSQFAKVPTGIGASLASILGISQLPVDIPSSRRIRFSGLRRDIGAIENKIRRTYRVSDPSSRLVVLRREALERERAGLIEDYDRMVALARRGSDRTE